MNQELKNIIRDKSGYIFDLDGTLVDLEDLNCFGFKNALQTITGFNPTRKEYLACLAGKKIGDGFITFLEKKGQKPDSLKSLIYEFHKAKRRELHDNFSSVARLKPNAKNLLELLKIKNFENCLATSTIKEFTNIILEKFNIKQFFDCVLTAEDISRGKPNPEIYQKALARLNKNPEEALAFEDSLFGIQAAQSANIFCVGFHTPGVNDKSITQADFSISNYQEVINVFL